MPPQLRPGFAAGAPGAGAAGEGCAAGAACCVGDGVVAGGVCWRCVTVDDCLPMLRLPPMRLALASIAVPRASVATSAPAINFPPQCKLIAVFSPMAVTPLDEDVNAEIQCEGSWHIAASRCIAHLVEQRKHLEATADVQSHDTCCQIEIFDRVQSGLFHHLLERFLIRVHADGLRQVAIALGVARHFAAQPR